jgi:hypothetical protein
MCSSYQVTMDYRDDDEMTPFLRCEACGAEAEQHDFDPRDVRPA